MTKGKRPLFQPDRKPAAQTPGGEQGASPEPPPAPVPQARPPRNDRLPFDMSEARPHPSSRSLEDEGLPVGEPDDRPTGIVFLDAAQAPFSLDDDDLPMKEPDDRPTSVISLDFTQPLPSFEDDGLPAKEPDDRPTSVVSLADAPFSLEEDGLPVKEADDRPTSVVSLESTDPFPSLLDDGLPAKEPDDRPTSVVSLESTDPFPSLSHEGLPAKEPDDRPTSVVAVDSTQPLPSLEDDGLPVTEPDDRPTGVVSLNDALPPFSLEASTARSSGLTNERPASAERAASAQAASAPAVAKNGKRAAAPSQPKVPVSHRIDDRRGAAAPPEGTATRSEAAKAPKAPPAPQSDGSTEPLAAAASGSPAAPKPPFPPATSSAPASHAASPAAGPARLTREAPLAYRPSQADPGRVADAPITGPEVSTSVGPHPAAHSSPEPASPLSSRPGAYSRAQAGTQRTEMPRAKTAAEPEPAPAPIDPAVQRRLAIVGVAAACILVPIFVYGFFVSTHRPSSEELWVLYPSDERSGRAAPPSHFHVEFEYLGSTPCMKNGSPDCLLYEYSYRSFTGRMAVRLGASGWERVDTAPEATPP